ncbi:MAG: pilus assembly protein [Acidimicrobiia bacterium]|nr:pilus assembly protein [Acidimicrobiia bacterium]MDH3398123.1 pilus assembly protein [Acidimicrobiia bacterium]MDH5616095.1 pilus assembly protein [Acidimicrobiia bacterium]
MNLRTGEKGAALVEMALVLPLLLLLVFGLTDLARALFTNITVVEAAQEGALYASYFPDVPTDIQQRAVDSVDDIVIAPTDVTAVVDLASCTATITVDHDYPLMTPVGKAFLGDTVTLSHTVTSTIFAGGCVPSTTTTTGP